MIIGITGGSGSGKSTLLKVLEEHGFTVLDCDAIYHELLRTDSQMLESIHARFPGVIAEGKLDRKKLGGIVFADPAALEDLNAITHRHVKEKVQSLLPQSAPAAIDAIGLFESGLADLCHITVAVTAPVTQRIQRLIERDGISEEYARSRIAAQLSDEAFSACCDYTLINDGDKDSFQLKCLAFLKENSII